ncbi:MAG: hypothetical protein DME32_07400 [Verrucomicrobia bacterium]|nr:MAG: hypothetical protein DME32_07400 [Verrucomicrobiota bacterium]
MICPGLRVPEFQTARSKQLKIQEGGDSTLDDTDTRQPVAIANANCCESKRPTPNVQRRYHLSRVSIGRRNHHSL